MRHTPSSAFISGWPFGMFLSLGWCEWWCEERPGERLVQTHAFIPLRMWQGGFAGFCDDAMLNFLKHSQPVLPKVAALSIVTKRVRGLGSSPTQVAVWLLFFYYSFIYVCIHCLGHFSPSPLSPHHFQAEPVLLLSLILFKRRHKHNKKDKAFLVLELRVAIQRDS
jgi:hypothetical protein